MNNIQKAFFATEYSKDFNASRAAVCSGYPPEQGFRLVEDPEIQAALLQILQKRLDKVQVDAQWVLQELVDNHYLARQNGQLGQSNRALHLIAQHASIDAFAADKIQIHGDSTIMDRLARARAKVDISFI